MRVLFPTGEANGLESLLASRFGRSPGFLIVDAESDEVSFVPNRQNLTASQGAGIQAAENAVGHDIDAVVAGNCGPKAFRVLTEAGVDVYLTRAATVGEALKALKEGTLKKLSEPNVAGHWG